MARRPRLRARKPHEGSPAVQPAFRPDRVQKELVLGNEVIERAVPGYRVETMSLPLGVLPKPASLAVRGRWNGRTYNFSGVMLVGAGPAPFGKSFDRADPAHPQRTPALDKRRISGVALATCAETEPGAALRLGRGPGTIAFPRALEKNLRPAFSSRARAY